VAQADTDTNFSQGKTSAKQEELSAWLRPAKESPRALAHVNKALALSVRPQPKTLSKGHQRTLKYIHSITP
jgi:hypothetical protein